MVSFPDLAVALIVFVDDRSLERILSSKEISVIVENKQILFKGERKKKISACQALGYW